MAESKAPYAATMEVRAAMARLDGALHRLSLTAVSEAAQHVSHTQNGVENSQLKSEVQNLHQEIQRLSARNAELEATLPFALEKVELAIEALNAALNES